ESPYIQAKMIDLSGSGARLEISEKVKIKDILLIKMKIKNSDIVLKGEIVRIEIGSDGKKRCGIKFIDITQTQTDKIIEELFLVMRKQRELT
ncbi:MAG: PilZ domain-containing protein, partial [Clostridium sp.]